MLTILRSNICYFLEWRIRDKGFLGLHQLERQYREFCPSADRLFGWSSIQFSEVEKIHIKRPGKGRAALFENGQSFYRFFCRLIWVGGNGVDNGDVEILTTDVGTLSPMVRMPASVWASLAAIVTFNNQYCLTAKQYSERFGLVLPILKCVACWEILRRLQDYWRTVLKTKPVRFSAWCSKSLTSFWRFLLLADAELLWEQQLLSSWEPDGCRACGLSSRTV